MNKASGKTNTNVLNASKIANFLEIINYTAKLHVFDTYTTLHLWPHL